MKESYWAYFIIILGISIITIMMLVQRMTTTTEEDYYLSREVLESSMIDAIDYGTYRTTGKVIMSKQKFIEVFVRRFAASVANNKTYELSFYDIYEDPPKATVKIRTSNGSTALGSESFDIKLDTTLSGIVETIYGVSDKIPNPTPNPTPSSSSTSSSSSSTKPPSSSSYESSCDIKRHECNNSGCYISYSCPPGHSYVRAEPTGSTIAKYPNKTLVSKTTTGIFKDKNNREYKVTQRIYMSAKYTFKGSNAVYCNSGYRIGQNNFDYVWYYGPASSHTCLDVAEAYCRNRRGIKYCKTNSSSGTNNEQCTSHNPVGNNCNRETVYAFDSDSSFWKEQK